MVGAIAQREESITLDSINNIVEDLGTWEAYTPQGFWQVLNAGCGQVDISVAEVYYEDWWEDETNAPRISRTLPESFSCRFQITDTPTVQDDTQTGIYIWQDNDNVAFWGFWGGPWELGSHEVHISLEAVVNNQGYNDANPPNDHLVGDEFSWLGITHISGTWEFWYYTQGKWIKSASMVESRDGVYTPNKSLGFVPTRIGLVVKEWSLFDLWHTYHFRNIRFESR